VLLVSDYQGTLEVIERRDERTWLGLEELPQDKEIVPSPMSCECGVYLI